MAIVGLGRFGGDSAWNGTTVGLRLATLGGVDRIAVAATSVVGATVGRACSVGEGTFVDIGGGSPKARADEVLAGIVVPLLTGMPVDCVAPVVAVVMGDLVENGLEVKTVLVNGPGVAGGKIVRKVQRKMKEAMEP
ncbi:MAG: hypothetical protein Q7O66_06510 [Dehalococcoidia bacterium]|nr:hypothetical protein [Dehalococcoidia bacterium]